MEPPNKMHRALQRMRTWKGKKREKRAERRRAGREERGAGLEEREGRRGKGRVRARRQRIFHEASVLLF